MVAETNRPSRFHVKSPQVRDESHLWELMREALAVTTIALRAHVEKENLFPAHCLTLLASTLSPKEEKIVKNGEKKKGKKVPFKRWVLGTALKGSDDLASVR